MPAPGADRPFDLSAWHEASRLIVQRGGPDPGAQFTIFDEHGYRHTGDAMLSRAQLPERWWEKRSTYRSQSPKRDECNYCKRPLRVPNQHNFWAAVALAGLLGPAGRRVGWRLFRRVLARVLRYVVAGSASRRRRRPRLPAGQPGPASGLLGG